MNRHIYYLARILDNEVMKSLSALIAECDLNSEATLEHGYFQDFIDNCYRSKRESRPSVSQLADIFRKYGCNKPGTLACHYAKKLESMAHQYQHLGFIV